MAVFDNCWNRINLSRGDKSVNSYEWITLGPTRSQGDWLSRAAVMPTEQRMSTSKDGNFALYRQLDERHVEERVKPVR